MAHEKRLRGAWFGALRPPARLSLASWAEANIRLPDGLSAVSGPIRLYPFQHGIADAITDPAMARVTVQKSARVGYSTLLIAALGHFVENDPSPILVVLPTESDARNFFVSNIEPIFGASPVLAGAIETGGRASRSTLLSRLFPGGFIKAVAAKAPRNLRGHTARIAVVDELDAMDVTADGPVLPLVSRRTDSFADRKIICGSTPVYEDTSPTIKAYGESDQRVYEVPCPHCGGFHEVRWADIRWPDGEPERAYWCCPSCGGVVEERGKGAMVAAGRWRATRPEVTGHAGFRLNSLISPVPNARWGVLAREFIAAKNDPPRLQVFVNTALGEGWRTEGDELDENDLQARAEPFGLEAIPEDVLAITVGVDVQDDRLEAAIVGWTETGAALVLGHHVIWQPYDSDGAWLELDDLLKTRWKHPLGGTIGVDTACVDSGAGAHMEHVYKFCFPRWRRGVMAIKGVSGNRPFIEQSKSKPRGGKLWIVGVDSIKYHAFMKIAGKSPMIRFSADLSAEWFEQLTSERVVVVYHRGQPQRRIERIPGRRAEALDCTVYAIAAHKIIENRNWARRREDLQRAVPVPSSAKPRPHTIRSVWVDS